MCNDIYHRGMLNFEATCEKIVMAYPEEIQNVFQKILDDAQMVFEQSKVLN